MHFLETYALNCGAKIDKPFILENYFPVPFDKYITFQAQSKYPAKDYDFWQDVIDIIYPYLIKNDINILQVGGQGEVPYQRVIDLRGQTTIPQLAYLVNRAKLHLGPDSLGVHLASCADIPLVALYSVTKENIAGPYFGDKNKQILLNGYARLGNRKPSFSAQEQPKSINLIKPEEVANSVLKLLNYPHTVPFQTVYTGPRYTRNIIQEVIPDSNMMLPNRENPIEIRFDLHPDEKLLAHFLFNYKRCVVVTDTKINLNLLTQFKSNILMLVYKVTETNDLEFPRQISKLGVNTVFISEMSDDLLASKKIHFYDIGTIHKLNQPDEKVIDSLRKHPRKLYFRSAKMTASNGKMFASHAHQKEDALMQNNFEYQRIIDSPLFWKDLDFYTIVELL